MTGQGYVFGLDLDDSTTYVEVDANSVDESMNEVVDTWFKLADGGFATSEVVALDPEFALVFKFQDATDVTLKGILEKRLKLGADRNVGFEIVDNATGNTITGSGTLTAISNSRVADLVIEVSVSMKLRGAPTITVTA